MGASREELHFRLAGRSDAAAVAALHADSWSRHYRGAYRDDFLDHRVHADRLAVWTDRLAEPDPGSQTLLAEQAGRLLGFACTVFDDDPSWGALLDNLHVISGSKRQGIGSGLLALTARAVLDRAPGCGCGCSSRTSMPRRSTRLGAQGAWSAGTSMSGPTGSAVSTVRRSRCAMPGPIQPPCGDCSRRRQSVGPAAVDGLFCR